MKALTSSEIDILESNGCWAEDWSSVEVADEGFNPEYVHRARFYGSIRLGANEESIEVSKGFYLHSGINDATLRNVSIGDNCLIDRIGGYINDYTIGSDCYIANVATIETTEGASYGEGNVISVLNEAGDGNLIIFSSLSSQMAAFMVRNVRDADLRNAMRRLIGEEVERTMPDRGVIGSGVKIVNTTSIINSCLDDGCEVNGATRLSDCTIKSSRRASVFIGSNVIIENSIIADGSSVIDGVKLLDCFVGEACQISNGFTASQSVFFANTVMSCGEACAAFCGPFSASHHKSSLLIGGEYSFYNAGSATNFSNHAYKMGPIHWGILERGSKTASGSYLLMPAHIGSFSVVMGKIMNHPHTDGLPFSYIIGDNDATWLVPGRNISTVGLYRDVHKWQQRDMRPREGRMSVVDFDWLSPYTVSEIQRGKIILENIRKVNGDDVSVYHYHGMCIKRSSLEKGLKNYDIALHLFMGKALQYAVDKDYETRPIGSTGLGKWLDVGGQLMPQSEEQRLVDDVKEGNIETVQDVADRFLEIEANYATYSWRWAYRMILEYYKVKEIDEATKQKISDDYEEAKKELTADIIADARKEFSLGDVSPDTLDAFIKRF